MKTTILKVLFILLILLIGTSIAGENEQKENVKNFKVEKGGFLEVYLSPGDIKVSTWEKDEILVKALGITEEEFNELSIEKSGNKVTIKMPNNIFYEEDFVLLVSAPSNFNLNLKTSGGDIEIKDKIIGTINVLTAGGNISTNDINGNTSLSTSGGDIRIGNINGELNVNTQGGDIKAGNISGEAANVQSMGGDITINDSHSQINIKTMGGDIKVNNTHSKVSAITFGGDIKISNMNSGGSIETFGGEIYIDGSRGSVHAETKGGEIKMKNIKGNVIANTASGNIYLEFLESLDQESKISTLNGEINFVVSKELKVTIIAEVKIKNNWNQDINDISINSDFPAKSDSSKEKSKIKTFELNGGGTKIFLNTLNADINIKSKK